LSRNYSQETGSLPRSQAWWFQVIASHRIDYLEGSIGWPNRTKTAFAVSPRSIDHSSRHISIVEDTRVITFSRSQGRAWETGVFFWVRRNHRQNDAPYQGPCTKCIITHTTFLLKPLFSSSLSPLQLYPRFLRNDHPLATSLAHRIPSNQTINHTSI
jgi:hypothetical protein